MGGDRRREPCSGEVRLFAYRTVDGVIDGTIPYRWELGTAHLPGLSERALLVGQDFSPALDQDECSAPSPTCRPG